MQQSIFDNSPIHFELPDTQLSYYPDFIAHHESVYEALLDKLEWQQDTISMYGKPVKIPRLNAWYGDSNAHYAYSGLALSPLAWTPLLLDLKQQLEQFLDCSFNSVLANHYRNGQDSVAWHSDDEQELGHEPLIASLSFGATRSFTLRHKFNEDQAPVKIDLAGGSLLVMAGTTQRCWQHQLAKTRSVVAGRINLTFRQIVV